MKKDEALKSISNMLGDKHIHISDEKEIKPNEMELYKKIDVYYKWFMNDCSSPYDELEWLIKTLLESKHKEDMMQVLNDTYEDYKN